MYGVSKILVIRSSVGKHVDACIQIYLPLLVRRLKKKISNYHNYLEKRNSNPPCKKKFPAIKSYLRRAK